MYKSKISNHYVSEILSKGLSPSNVLSNKTDDLYISEYIRIITNQTIN